jgi:hypothetical protein
MSLLGIDLHSNRITVARLAVKNEAFETIMSTYTFERDSFQRFCTHRSVIDPFNA